MSLPLTGHHVAVLLGGLSPDGRAVICLREPSLGPCFGVKGGAAGGEVLQPAANSSPTVILNKVLFISAGSACGLLCSFSYSSPIERPA